MSNAELKQEADRLMSECRLAELLRPYREWFVGGSYGYDLMCWRDLDIYALDPEHDLTRCFEIGHAVTSRLGAKKSFFTNNVGGEPSGLYWGIRLGDTRTGAWKLDLWLLDAVDYERHMHYVDEMNARLTPEIRSIILEIKEAYWRRPEYRGTVTSDRIYRAVLDEGVRDVDGFQRVLEKS